jgi:hypothetical protein
MKPVPCKAWVVGLPLDVAVPGKAPIVSSPLAAGDQWKASAETLRSKNADRAPPGRPIDRYDFCITQVSPSLRPTSLSSPDPFGCHDRQLSKLDHTVANQDQLGLGRSERGDFSKDHYAGGASLPPSNVVPISARGIDQLFLAAQEQLFNVPLLAPVAGLFGVGAVLKILVVFTTELRSITRNDAVTMQTATPGQVFLALQLARRKVLASIGSKDALRLLAT